MDTNCDSFEINQFWCADSTGLVADLEKLCQWVTELGLICKSRKLQVNMGKNNAMRCKIWIVSNECAISCESVHRVT